MRADKRGIQRLRRLARVRQIASREAAAECARAEGALAQLDALTARTRALVGDYAAPDDAANGFDVRQSALFAAGLCRIVSISAADGANARDQADKAMAELASAERRRTAAEDRADQARKALGRSGHALPGGRRRVIGTDVE